MRLDSIMKTSEEDKKVEPNYSRNNWGYIGKDFSVGKFVLHKTISGTTYLKDSKGTLRRLTQKLVDEIEKMGSAPTSEKP